MTTFKLFVCIITYSAQVALTDRAEEMPIARSKIQFNFCIQINWKRKSIITDKIVSLENFPVELVAYLAVLLLSRTEVETSSILEK